MTLDRDSRLDTLGALVERGPGPRPPRKLREWPRRAARSMLLRAFEPHAYHQRELDRAITEILGEHERDLAGLPDRVARLEELSLQIAGLGHRVARLEELTGDIVSTLEALRRTTSARTSGAVGSRTAGLDEEG